MYDVRTRLDQDLKATVSRLRELGGAAAAEARLGTSGGICPFADEVDWIQASESREIGFATRELVLERVNRLSAALERMNEGEYGACVDCDEPISLARLSAMPEVQTCVRCQARLEHLGPPRPIIYGNGVRQRCVIVLEERQHLEEEKIVLLPERGEGGVRRRDGTS